MTPRPDYFGFAGFIYTLMDASGATSTGRVELYFDPVNDAPRLHDQRRVIRLEQTTTITVAELMAGTAEDLRRAAIVLSGTVVGTAATAIRPAGQRPSGPVALAMAA